MTLKFTAKQEDLLILGNLARITNKIFPNIKIEATSCDVLTCSSTDGYTFIQTKVKCINGEGVCCIEGKKFVELINKASGKIEFDGGVIKFNKNKFKLPISDINNFMKFENIDGTETNLESVQLIKQLKKTTFAADNSGRGVLNGISINSTELAATDGNILVVNKLDSEIKEQIILPKTLCEEAIRCFEGVKELKIITNKTRVCFIGGNLTIVSNLIDGTYPPYNQLIPKETKITVILDKQIILSALEVLSVVKNISTNVCVLEFLDNNLRISVNNADGGEGDINIDVDYTAEPLKIAFNIEYLKSILKNTCDEVFEMGLTAPLSPALIKNSDDVVVIMPVQLRG